MTKLRTAALLAIALMLPVAAWATSQKVNLDLERIDSQLGEWPAITIPSDAAPPLRCDRNDRAEEGEATDAYAAGCCWFYFVGFWWCVPC